MTPVFQTLFGPKGNCFQACVASLFDTELDHVPAFHAFDDWGLLLRAWAKDNYGVETVFTSAYRYPLFLEPDKPAGYSINSHLLFNGDVHAAVFLDGWLAHDPSPRPFCKIDSLALLWTTFLKGEKVYGTN